MKSINKGCQAAVLFLMLIAAASCHKKDNDVPAVVNTDSSLVQSYYTVNGPTADTLARILVAPFNTQSVTDSGVVMIMDGSGRPIKERRTPHGVTDFRRWTINGEERYTWFVYDADYYIIPSITYRLGYVVVADANLNELKRISLTAHGDITTTKNQGLDPHDFILIDDNHYIAMTYYEKTVTNVPALFTTSATTLVATPVIQEVSNGQVIWQWDASDYPEFYTTSVEGNQFTDSTIAQDYMHMNSMIIDPKDGNLICSYRNLNQILKINRQTGNIMWRLGGTNSDFVMTDDMKFLRQHNATLIDGGQTLLLFDNGHISLRPYSRVLEFQLDETSKTILSYKSYVIPEAFTQYMGSVQKTGDHYFIGGGTANYVLDVNFLTGEKTLEMKSNLSTYRAYKY